MFSFLNKKSPSVIPAKAGIHQIDSTESLTLRLQGLHCSSCATIIDLTLEDLPSVEATTNYAKSETKVYFDPTQTSLEKIKSTITSLGYKIE